MSSNRQARTDYDGAFHHYAGALSDYADYLEKEIAFLRARYVSPIPFDNIVLAHHDDSSNKEQRAHER